MRIYFEEERFNGGTVTTIKFKSGAVAIMHLTSGQSGTGPLERVEVIDPSGQIVNL